MRKNRKFNPVQFSKNIVALEVLEQKLLMTGLSPSSNITPPSTNGWTIVTFDTQLNTSNISPNPGYNAIPSSFSNGANYTLRQIVGYYDNVYNSTQDWTVSLSANTTYTLSAYDAGSGASRGENNNSYGDLDVFAGAYSGMGHLILSAPAGSPATITCDSLNGSKLDRIFNIMSGGSLILKNVIITGGLAKDNGSYPNTDAFGGGILVESGGSLSLESSTITQNYAIGSNGPNVIGANSNTRQAAGYNAAGAGIYGSAGSTITIDSASVISYNNIRGGKGGNVSSASFNNGAGGSGGNAYGAGIAINAPASGSVQTTSTYPTNLYLDGGAVIANNQINNVTTQTNGTKIYGGTGGSCAGGKGGSGGNAYGAGLFMSSGALNMDGGSLKTAVNISNNSSNYGHGYTSNTTSSSNVGANGLANGAGSYLAPGLVTVANSPSSGGILQFSNNTANGVISGLYLPTVSASVADSPIAANGPWNLRTAVAATTALSNTGMNIGLNLGSGNFTLNQGTGLSIQGNEGSGASASSSISGKVTGLSISNGGSGYQSAPSVTLSSPVSGTAAQATATVSGSVSSVNLTNAGSGYTSAPSVTFSGGGGSGASGTVNFTPAIGIVNSLILTNAGSVKYKSGSPGSYQTSVTISGGGGSGATGYGTVSWTLDENFQYEGKLTGLVLTNSGSGYTSDPSVTVNWPNATASASVSFTTSSAITGITLTSAGSGYTSAPTVTLTGGGGSGVTATATMNLNITGLTLTNAGSGYTSAPTVTFSGGGGSGASAIASESNSLSGITLTSVGSNYYTNPTVIISGGGGSGATATATVSNGVVSSVSITNAGSGYTSAPSVIFQLAPTNPITINGAGKSASKIIGDTSTNSIFNLVNKNVIFSNLTLTGATVSGTNGGAISATNAAVTLNSVSVTNNSVKYNSGNGGGIYQNGGSLILNNSNISNNNVANGSGGGIFSIDGVLESNNTSISYNKATGYWGGGLYANSANVTLANTTMVYNTDVNQTGGGICQSGGSLTIQNSNISYNNATTGGGGGIFVNEGCDLNISGGTISYNSAVGSGGGIQGYGSGLIKIKGTTIKNNSSGNCGGGVAHTGGSMSLTSASLSNNSATNGEGGGLYQPAGTLRIKSKSTIKSNTATQGAGLFLTEGSATITGGSIENNIASYIGGGIVSYNNNNLNMTSVSVKSNQVVSGSTPAGYGGGMVQSVGGTLNLKNSVVSNNNAAQGGGLFFYTSTLNASGSSFKSNTATSIGAGIYARTNTKAMNFTSANISSNTISGSGASSGAGIYVSGGTLNTNGFNLKNNKITATSNATIQGAGIYATGTSINFNGETSKTTTISGNQLVGNGGGTAYGAGISAQAGTFVNNQSVNTISNNTITSTANGVGGAIAFFANTSYAQSYYTTCTGNSANAGGNDYAFQVAYTGDNSSSPSQNGPSGISYFTNTSGSGSLRNAIEYCQTWMNGNSNNNSMAIMLSSTSYGLNASSGGQLETQVANSNSLTIIGIGSSQSIITACGTGTRPLWVNNASGGALVLQNLNITGGNTTNIGNPNGGGIYLSNGTLTLNDVTVSGNKAGYTGTAAAGGNSAVASKSHAANGGNGTTGSSGYGGGIYMAGGTLNLLSNSNVTGNYVYGEKGGNGGNGQNGSVTFHQKGDSCAVSGTHAINGGNGGNGGAGGSAMGGGIYQAAGNLNSPSGSANIYGNTASPGAGGSLGSGGSGGSYSETICSHTYTRTSNAGSNGSNGAKGSSNANYDHAGGGTVFSSNSTASAQSIGGLYQSAGSINQAALRFASVPKRLPGVTIELYSDDDKLIATATTDQNGRYRFNTNYSGIGYLYVEPLKTFVVSEKGSQFSGGVTSAFDPASGKTDPVQLIDGVVVNTNLNLVLSKIDSGLIVKGNSIRLNRTGTHSALWQTQLMPKSYYGGFTLSTFDVNNDTTSDYVLITKTGKPLAFIVDARTGQSTKLSGQVASNLRNGFIVQTANVQGDSTKELILAPSRERSGRISVIDLQAQKVLWNATDFVLGGMKINQIGSDPSGKSVYSSFQLVSLRQTDTFKIINGATGKLQETVSANTRRAEKRQAMKAEKMQSASIASVPNATQATVSIPRRRLPVMN